MNSNKRRKLTSEATQESSQRQGTDGDVSDRPLDHEGADESLHVCAAKDYMEDEMYSAPFFDDQNVSEIEVEIQRLRSQQMDQHSSARYIPLQARSN